MPNSPTRKSWTSEAPSGWATPLITALIACTFFGPGAVSKELEDPFGREANPLAPDDLYRVCESSVYEPLGGPAQPVLPGLPANNYHFSFLLSGGTTSHAG